MTRLLFAGVTAAPLCTPSGSRAGRRRPSSTAFSRPALTRRIASSASYPAACATRRRPRFSPRPGNRCGGFARASKTEVRRPATLGGTRRVRTRTASKPPLRCFDYLVGRPPRRAASLACAWSPPTPRPHSWHRHGQAGERGLRREQRPPGRSTIPTACWRVRCRRRPGSETNPDGVALLRRRLPMKRHHTNAARTATATSVRPRGAQKPAAAAADT
ncbi:hypothetical protein BU14_0071s0017 [Porphyra umbilicalis]|uniref:Uncharacterized protein n=1 Tax=Porphyra umbilicalis TaxID=2786 RepID=A0A1X6PGG0_PORUM|nr:hypothetical protein BU14_0071s0017 [Porphyra umbilicalis]|eukprot:OSX79763.1 hypothetical protein BU14_0071s0017 [Porphyra umbilicalis]